MPPSSVNAVQIYLNAMRQAHSFGAHTAETTFYTPLANLLNAVGDRLKPRVHFQAHPGTHGAGLADGGFFPIARSRDHTPLPGQLPERGAVEIKPPGYSLNTLANSAQVLRYLKTYGLCLISNYHQFRLLDLRHGTPHTLESYDLTPSASDLWTLPPAALIAEHAETLPDFLQRVMTRKVPLEKPKDVAWLLASYAREARARAATHPIAAFLGVRAALEDSLGITFEGDKGEHFFRSTLIQTLFYGIFSAWILWRRTPEAREPNALFNWRLSASYLRLPVLRSLFHAITEPGALNTVQLQEVLDRATDALNRVQPVFFNTFNDENAVNYFYEPFLEAFDPDLRKQLGVWYTPREIVRYMVERVDHLLRMELHEPLGLASPNVQVLDPCCGTGAYLVEVLHRIHRTLLERAGDDDALVPSDLRRAATTRVFGFEIMPAPFVIAHLQVANLLEKAGAALADTQRAQVFLTNALTGWVPVKHPQSRFGYEAFTEERDAAEAVKQADTILVILGNPPYNGYAGIAQIEEERGLTTAYRTPVPGLAAPQGQGLNDLYVRFFRIAERRIVGDSTARGNHDGRGLVSFISNNAWLDGLSHVSMRARYLREFQSIYIDNLHGDKYRTGKTTPDGKPDPSAFSTPQNREGIQVGTAIATLVRNAAAPIAIHALPTGDPIPTRNPMPKGNTSPADTPTWLSSRPERSVVEGSASPPIPPYPPRPLHLRNVWGTQKLSHLDREAKREADPAYEAITPVTALGLPFAERVHNATYTDWPRLPELFAVSFPGIKTSRDPLVVDIDRDRLVVRMKKYFDPSISDEQIDALAPGEMQDGYMYSARAIRAELQMRGFREWEVLRYAYRPFDMRWIYWEPETPLLRRKVDEYVKALPGKTLTLVSQQKSRSSYQAPLVIRELGCIDLLDRSATCLPFTHIPECGPLLDISQPEPNISQKLQLTSQELGFNSEDLFFHALTTMHTPLYRTENAGALLGDWPRIPLPATAALLAHSATLGRKLAELLDPESKTVALLYPESEAEEGFPLVWSFLASLKLPKPANLEEHLKLTAGWGNRGQGSTVMPGRGHLTTRPWTDPERIHLTWIAEHFKLTLNQTLALLGETCVDVHLNGTSLWSAVPANVWSYTLGGYQVLKKWLSYRELPLLGRPLRDDEARYFAQVVRRITAILLLGPALDASYAAILPTATGLPAR